MSDMDERVLALAGLVQALRQVRQIAENGQADEAIVGTALQRVTFQFSTSWRASAGSKRPRGMTSVSPTMTARRSADLLGK